MANDNRVSEIYSELFSSYPKLLSLESPIFASHEAIVQCFESGGRLFVCGNGGSASDALHIVGEFMKSFVIPRPIDKALAAKLCDLFPDDDFSILQKALPTYALVENSALSSAIANDISSDLVFAQQINGYARSGDALLCISTSGNAKNVALAAKLAKAMDVKTIALTGRDGGILAKICDCAIIVPERETYKIQEAHLPIYHAICRAVEMHFFENL